MMFQNTIFILFILFFTSSIKAQLKKLLNLKTYLRYLPSETCNDPQKCNDCDSYSNKMNLCLTCNSGNNYYPKSEDKSKKYKECILKTNPPNGYYFNENSDSFEKCYENCLTCSNGGNINENNCIKCKENYKIIPNSNNNNCVLSCPFYYYLIEVENSENTCLTPEYICTESAECPIDFSLINKQKNTCLKSCTDDIEYKFQYNGECLKKCPDGTIENNNLCLDENSEKECKMAEINYELSISELNENSIKIFVKNYINEFSYTNNHVSIYKNPNYIISLYENIGCLNTLQLNITKADLTDCLSEVMEKYSLKSNEILSITIDLLETNTKKFSYIFYDSKNFKQIKIDQICKEKMIVEKNILEITKLNEYLTNFLSQEINIFNKSEPFYTDICFHFDSPNGKDVPLKDRFKTYFPNITLCDEECENIGINYTSMTAICKCDIKNSLADKLKNNFLDEDNAIMEIISEANLEVLKCYKDIFKIKYLIKNIGSIIIFLILLVEIISVVLFFEKGFYIIKIFVFNIINKFNEASNKIKNKNNNNLFLSSLQSGLYDSKSNLQLSPPKKNPLQKKSKFAPKNPEMKISSDGCLVASDDGKNFSNKEIVLFDNNKKDKTDKSQKNVIPSKFQSKDNINVSSNLNKKRNSNIPKNFSSSFLKDFSKDIHSSINQVNVYDIIDENLDDLDFKEALIKENRTFCEIFVEKLKENLDILNIFIFDDLEPRSLKIILFMLKVDIYFVSNGLFYNEEYISELFYSTKKENFFSFLTRSVNRIFYCSLVGIVIDFLLDWFFQKSNQIKYLIQTAKLDMTLFRNSLFDYMKSIKKKYIIFIILTLVLTLFSWYYVTCFNNVYPNTKYEWIKSSIVIIFVMQLISLAQCFIYTVLRKISLKCKVEGIYKISQNFS